MNENLLKEWDKECEDIHSDKRKLLDQMKDNLKDGESSDILYRMAKICMFLSKSAEISDNKELEKSMAIEALSLAGKACKEEPDNSECHKWYCAAVNKLANLSDTRDKIKYGLQFKEHADISLKLNPNDPLMQSIYGQWCYNMASMSWVQKKLAQTLFVSLPDVDYDMALNAFLKVQELKPESQENHLWLAKVLIAKNQTTEAKHYIQNGFKFRSNNSINKELEELNEKLK